MVVVFRQQHRHAILGWRLCLAFWPGPSDLMIKAVFKHDFYEVPFFLKGKHIGYDPSIYRPTKTPSHGSQPDLFSKPGWEKSQLKIRSYPCIDLGLSKTVRVSFGTQKEWTGERPW